MPILFVHPRRGLYQITKCQDCGYVFGCDHCDAKLTTYRAYEKNLQLICHQCQSYYNYPNCCPMCKGNKIDSKYGGIDELAELLKKEYQLDPIKIDSKSKIIYPNQNEDPENEKVFLTTRIFDPLIPYSSFSKIIFIHAENLMASPDYLVGEETYRNLSEIFLQVTDQTEVIFDTTSPHLAFFQDLIRIHCEHSEYVQPRDWYEGFLETEKETRDKFGFPPFQNLVLITTQEKNKEKSGQLINSARKYLMSVQKEFPEIKITTPYPARFLKRRGMFSFHLLVKYPRQYSRFFEFQKIIRYVKSQYRVQVRLNPRHLF
jgi:primosomal protein N' (replication factor Y) (superfamily II helicase)